MYILTFSNDLSEPTRNITSDIRSLALERNSPKSLDFDGGTPVLKIRNYRL